MMKRNILFYTIFLLAAVVAYNCRKEMPNQPKANQLPTTRIWLQSDQTLLETSSRQHVYWYGEDPDGQVVGYIMTVVSDSALNVHIRKMNNQLPSPDTLTYFWTTKTDSIMPLPLLQKRDSFTIVIRAIDNLFHNPSLTEGAALKLSPEPYWDVNNDGIFNSGDIPLPSLLKSLDPKGAVQLFPLRNTPPVVYFQGDPTAADTTIPVQQPLYTYTVATFSWRGTDIDGDNTIRGFRIALNDTSFESNWSQLLSPATTTITLVVPRNVSDASAGNVVDAEVYAGTYPNLQPRGRVSGLRLNGYNRLYLKALDVAGEYSKAVRLPDSTSPTNNRTWYVKKPQSTMLFVLDYGSTYTTEKNAIIPYYRNVFNNPTILNGSLANFDTLDIVNQRPNNLNPALIKTLQLYDVVLWATDRFPSLQPAQIGLFNYTQSGGKVIFTTTFQTALSYADLRALNDFAPLDSTTSDNVNVHNDSANADSRISVMNGTVRTKVYSTMSGYPDLTVDSVTVTGTNLGLTGSHSLNMRRIYKRTDSQYIYRLDSSRVSPKRYGGSPNVACINNDKTFVMFALPLHILNGNPKNLPLFLKHVLEDEFQLSASARVAQRSSLRRVH
jgi:hypothetical protein